MEAKFYKRLSGSLVQCILCPHNCTIKPGKRGICGVRENKEGTLHTLVYGLPVAKSVDPIEKKPLYHFLPGTFTYSIATVGCNLRCEFCQNWDISQARPEDVSAYTLPPEAVVAQAKKNHCSSIAFTYVEPAIFYEYMLDTAKLAHQAGLKTVMVSNGFINPDPAKELFPFIDAINIDLKGFTDEFYQKICKARLQPVLDTIKLAFDMGLHVELTMLIIPTVNDDRDDIKKMCDWIVSNTSTDIPLHFSRFFPMFRMEHLPVTPAKTLHDAKDIAERAGIKNVFLGNI